MKIITCSNDYNCQIETEKIENQYVLKLDFNIKEYMILLSGKGWTKIKYPEEVLESIKDKVYISKEKLYDIIEILDTFIETGNIDHDKMNHTSRGFAKIDDKDIFGNEISIQKSSTMEEDQLWFGTKVNQNDIGHKKDGSFIRYKYEPNHGVHVHDRLHLTQNQAFQLRLAMLHEICSTWTRHELANLVDKQSQTGNEMIIDVWGDLHPNVQKTIFMYACSKGNLNLIKKIYTHPENKFLEDIFCTFEEFGLQMCLQPESKKILKFFKIMMKEKDMGLSHTMEKWVRENKLGRKIRLKN